MLENILARLTVETFRMEPEYVGGIESERTIDIYRDPFNCSLLEYPVQGIYNFLGSANAE